MKEKTIIVFAPHPDDETWGCGGTIAKKVSQGYEVLIVVMTDGRHAFFSILGIDSDPTPEELKEIRKEELKRSVKILGVPERNIIFLDFEDGTLEKNKNKVEEKVMEVLKKNPPTEIYFPYKRDFHPDHRVTNHMVKSSIKKLGLSPLQFQYSITHKYSRIGPIIDKLLNLFLHNMVRINVTNFLHIKKAAVKEFKSEMDIISTKQERPLVADIKKYIRKYEVFFTERRK